jgi:hypothetical protein
MAVPNITKYNEQEYEFEMYLDSGAGESDQRKYSINPNAIVNLNIEETLADWVTKGVLTIYDSFNALENTTNTTGILGEGPKYIFRNDGNDILYIRLFPKLKDLNLEVNQVHWELVYRFSIYDVEDIDLPPGAQNQASVSTKCKKFYFWDLWYHRMITNTLEYSTALSRVAPSKNYNGPVTDELRSIPTGIAMKEIIDKTLGGYFNIKGNVLDIAGGPNKEWDVGATNIFYTAPASNSAYDSLMDVYCRHVSTTKYSTAPLRTTLRGGIEGTSDNDFCILYKERGPTPGDEGYLALKPMSEFFDKAGKDTPGDYQIEHFYIQDYAPSEKIVPKVNRAPVLGRQDLQKDTSLGAYSQITSYRFVDISPFTNATEFVNNPVYSFDFLNRTFSAEFKQNTVMTARDFMTKKYISRLATARDSDESLFLLTLEKIKENQNVKPVYSLYGGDDENHKLARQADGLQKLLKTGVFQNACINFRCLGSTNREPGRFIAIDRQDGIEDNNFNNKLYGQWFVINIRHIFEGGIYYNEVTAVKLHRFKSLDVNFTGTI